MFGMKDVDDFVEYHIVNPYTSMYMKIYDKIV